jgi:hypothetical protein
MRSVAGIDRANALVDDTSVPGRKGRELIVTLSAQIPTMSDMTTTCHPGFHTTAFRSQTAAPRVTVRRAVLMIATVLVALAAIVVAISATHAHAAPAACTTSTMTSSLPAVDANGNYVSGANGCTASGTSTTATSPSASSTAGSSIAPALVSAVAQG